MGPSESSNNGLLFIKVFEYKGPLKSLGEWVVPLSFDTPIKHPPDPALICHKMALK